MTLSTRSRLQALGLAEGWTLRSTSFVDTYTRDHAEVAVGYQYANGPRAALRWCALFIDGEPVVRYGLLKKQAPGTGGGEIKLHVRDKAGAVSRWLREHYR